MGDTSLTQIEKLLALPDPLLAFKWVARSLPFGLETTYMESCDIPFNNLGISEAVFIGSRFAHFPGTHTISSFNANFYEDRNGRAHAWIDYWKRQVKNFDTGNYYLPKNYKRNMVISLLDQKNNPVITAKLKGVWPMDTSSLPLNYTDGSGRIVLQQGFSVDDSEMTYHRTQF